MLNLTHLEFVKTNKIADLLFLLIDPQIRGRKFQQREIDLDQLTDEQLRSRYRFGRESITYFFIV